MDFLKQKLLAFVSGFLKIVAEWKAPWVKKILTGDEIDEVKFLSQPGDILLVRAGGYFSTFLFWLFRLGDYTHCVFVHGKDQITDSTSVGVETRSMTATLVGYTKAVILRPKFTDAERENAWRKYKELMKHDEERGIKYNWELVEDTKTDGNGQPLPDELTCAQFIRVILNAGRENYMDLRKRFGFLTVSPQDYYAARSKYDIIKEWK